MTDKKVRWGIISTARIAETAFIPAVRETERGEIVAVASRSREKAEAFARKHHIPDAHGDYAELLARDDIDAVYNPLPNTMHLEWTRAAAAQGKHVFCEKPMAVYPEDAQKMIDACREAGVVLVDAFVFLCHPQTLKLRQLLDAGVIGQLLQMEAHMTFRLDRPSDNIRLNKDLGGGSMFDAGCYPITFSRFAMGSEPTAVQAQCFIDPELKIDLRTSLILSFNEHRTATIQTGFDARGGPGALLFGEKGHIEVPQPFHPKEQSQFTVHNSDGSETFTFDTGLKTFTPAIEQFHACVLDGASPLSPPEFALGTLRVIQAALESSASGRRVVIAAD
jgi:predicted dehydrogenase